MITNCEIARSRVVSVEMAVCELAVKIRTLGFDSLTLIPYRELYFRDLRTFSVDIFQLISCKSVIFLLRVCARCCNIYGNGTSDLPVHMCRNSGPSVKTVW